MNHPQRSEKKYRLKNFSSTTLGWELAIPIFGGLLIGYTIDRRIGTGYAFTLVFIVIGIIIGYYSLYKYIELEMLRKKVVEQQKKKED